MTYKPLVPAVGPHLRFPFHLAAETLVVVVSRDPAMVDRALSDLWSAAYVPYYGHTTFVRPPVVTRRPDPALGHGEAHDREVIQAALQKGQAVFTDCPAWCELVSAEANGQPFTAAALHEALGESWQLAKTAVLVVLSPRPGTDAFDLPARKWLNAASSARADLQHSAEALVRPGTGAEFLAVLDTLRPLGLFGQLAGRQGHRRNSV